MNPSSLQKNLSIPYKPFHNIIKTLLVAEWIHFTLFGIILPTIKLKVYTILGGLMNSATKP